MTDKPKNSVLLILDTNILNEESLKVEIRKAMLLVSEGRYLITLFKCQDQWESQLPIEAITNAETIGTSFNRTKEWEFGGNGAMRVYSTPKLLYKESWQWQGFRRIGDKAFTRRANLNRKILNGSKLPVKDQAFTRDVANNVWNIKYEIFEKEILNRFVSLLCWSDESLFLVKSGLVKKIKHQKMDLTKAVIGVPSKNPYFWEKSSTLF
jgi:hypothetical protein